MLAVQLQIGAWIPSELLLHLLVSSEPTFTQLACSCHMCTKLNTAGHSAFTLLPVLLFWLLPTTQENFTNVAASAIPQQPGSMVSLVAQVGLDMAMLPQLVAQLQLPLRVVELFMSYLYGQASAGRNISLPVSEQLWAAFPSMDSCPSLQLPGLLQVDAAVTAAAAANIQQQQQQQSTPFEVAGRHVAAANLLAHVSVFMPASNSFAVAAAAQARALPALTQQLGSIVQWQAEDSSSLAAAAAAAQPLHVTDLHVDLFSSFASAVPYRDIGSCGGFDARLSYLYQLAGSLPGQAAYRRRLKATRPGQWVVLTGARGADALAAAAAAAGDASTGGGFAASPGVEGSSRSGCSGQGSGCRVYGRMLQEQGAG